MLTAPARDPTASSPKRRRHHTSAAAPRRIPAGGTRYRSTADQRPTDTPCCRASPGRRVVPGRRCPCHTASRALAQPDTRHADHSFGRGYPLELPRRLPRRSADIACRRLAELSRLATKRRRPVWQVSARRGQPPLFSRDQRDAQQRYDDIIDAARRSHSRSLAAGEPLVNGTPIWTPFAKFQHLCLLVGNIFRLADVQRQAGVLNGPSRRPVRSRAAMPGGPETKSMASLAIR